MSYIIIFKRGCACQKYTRMNFSNTSMGQAFFLKIHVVLQNNNKQTCTEFLVS